MSYVQGEDRHQAALLPAAIEDYVAADAPVRVMDAFVDRLSVSELGFGRSVPAPTGRPPYDPRDLLKLYILGYFNEVRSSRRLERDQSRDGPFRPRLQHASRHQHQDRNRLKQKRGSGLPEPLPFSHSLKCPGFLFRR